MSDEKVVWFASDNEESWDCSNEFGQYGDREEAIKEGELSFGRPFWICCGRLVTVSDAAEWMVNCVRDEIDRGSFEEDLQISADDAVLSMGDEDANALVDVLAKFVEERRLLRTWWRLDHIERIEEEP